MSAALHKRESKIRTFFIKAALFVVALTMTAARIDAQTIPEGLWYERNGQGVTITKYTGTATTLVIPDTIAGLAVTHLEYRAFVECTSLTSVTFADGSGISALDFYDFYPFPGDLRNKYLAAAGGAGFSKRRHRRKRTSGRTWRHRRSRTSPETAARASASLSSCRNTQGRKR